MSRTAQRRAFYIKRERALVNRSIYTRTSPHTISNTLVCINYLRPSLPRPSLHPPTPTPTTTPCPGLALSPGFPYRPSGRESSLSFRPSCVCSFYPSLECGPIFDIGLFVSLAPLFARPALKQFKLQPRKLSLTFGFSRRESKLASTISPVYRIRAIGPEVFVFRGNRGRGLLCSGPAPIGPWGAFHGTFDFPKPAGRGPFPSGARAKSRRESGD